MYSCAVPFHLHSDIAVSGILQFPSALYLHVDSGLSARVVYPFSSVDAPFDPVPMSVKHLVALSLIQVEVGIAGAQCHYRSGTAHHDHARGGFHYPGKPCRAVGCVIIPEFLEDGSGDDA